MAHLYLGIDTGGTFTDFVLYDGAQLRFHKRLSTPHQPELAILAGIAELCPDTTGLAIIHGSTVATNAVLENKVSRVLYVTNRGFADVLTLGRQARRELYNLQPQRREPPVPHELCLEVGGRLAADGSVLEPLTADDLATLQHNITALSPGAVAINLLFSFRDDRYERQLADAIPGELFVSRSSAVLAEYREYERGMATWLNAAVGPVVKRYLLALRQGTPQARVMIMQSNGGTMAAEQAAQQAVNMLLSGPAGGLAAARWLAGGDQNCQFLTFDMGGTSTDVAFFCDDFTLTTEGSIAGYPVAIPMVDIHTIGAGGGSIASLDAGGALHVGPASAGANPGPACYGLGGTRATVTDANIVLGRIPPQAKFANLQLNLTAAREALRPLAEGINKTIEETAAGIVAVANEHMAQALRVISIQRGRDPRASTLLCFGGAGGLHVCALAEALGMEQILVPEFAGVLSAMGMLVAPPSRHLSRTLACRLDQCTEKEMQQAFTELAERGRIALLGDGLSEAELTVKLTVDVRYVGQSSSINLPWLGVRDMSETFHSAHEQRSGHRLSLPIEVVTIRAAISGAVLPVVLPDALESDHGLPLGTTLVYGLRDPVPVWRRNDLPVETSIMGPLVVMDSVATTYVAPAWQGRRSRKNHLILKRNSPGEN